MEEPSVHRDRLSELPESLIHHILSFLPMRDVISTTLLSKRWENLWTTVPCLNFCEFFSFEDSDEDEDDYERRTVESLKNFVNRALIFWRGVKILKFKIDIRSRIYLSLDKSDINVWTLFAVKNRVEDLKIKYRGIWAPQCLNTSSSIRKLSLAGCKLQIIGPPSWNQLKSLKIMSCDVQGSGEDLVNRVLLGSPQLEVFELQLEDNSTNLNIRSRSLKKLKIVNIFYMREDEPSLGTLRICCPNLETLEISGLFGSCLFTDVSSLIDATLGFSIGCISDGRWFSRLNELLGEPLKQVLSTIQHVEKITLSYLSVQVFVALLKKDLLPPLPNVKFLKLVLWRSEIGHVMDLLGSFPNLKMLVIVIELFGPVTTPDFNIDEIGTDLSKSCLLQLKTVEITADPPSFFGFIEFLLQHTIKLEKLVLCPNNRVVFVCEEKKKVMSMSTSSPNVQVIFKEQNW